MKYFIEKRSFFLDPGLLFKTGIILLLLAGRAFALPTPDVVIAVGQLLPIVLSSIAGFFSAIGVLLWKFAKRSNNPIRFYTVLTTVLLFLCMMITGYAAYTKYTVSGTENDRLANTAAYLRCDMGWHKTIHEFYDYRFSPRKPKPFSHLGSGIGWKELNNKIITNQDETPVLLTTSRYGSLLIYNSGIPAVGPENDKRVFEYVNSPDLKKYLLSIPEKVRSEKDLIIEGSSLIHFAVWPTEDSELEKAILSFRNFFWTTPLGRTFPDKEFLYTRDMDDALKKANTGSSKKIKWPVMDDSRFYIDTDSIKFPNWLKLLSFEEAYKKINNDNTILIFPYISRWRNTRVQLDQIILQLQSRWGELNIPDPDSKEESCVSKSPFLLNDKDRINLLAKHNVFILDYHDADFQVKLADLVETVRGKEFMIVTLSHWDWLVTGLDFAYRTYKDSLKTNQPFKYLGGSLEFDRIAAQWVVSGGKAVSNVSQIRSKTAAGIKYLNSGLTGSTAISLIFIAFLLWLTVLPISYLSSRSSLMKDRIIYRIKRDLSFISETQGFVEKHLKVNKLWELLGGLLSLMLIFPAYTIIVHENSPINHADFLWINNLGRPDWFLSGILCVVITVLILWQSAFKGGKPALIAKGWKILLTMVAFTIFCGISMPAGLILYATTLVVLRLGVNLLIGKGVDKLINRMFPQNRVSDELNGKYAGFKYEFINSITNMDKCGGKALNLFRLSQINSSIFSKINGIVLYLDRFQSPDDPEFHNSIMECMKGAFGSQENLKFAVRSSGVSEDGDKESHAGQFETVLNVPFSKVSKSVIRVYNSYQDGESNAVIVQPMVDAEYAGVAFTMSPQNRAVVEVEYIQGLGEELVSGSKTPKSVLFSRLTGKILQYDSSDKKTIFEQLFLSAMILENCFGGPQDIEWAVDKKTGLHYILQIRPVTKFMTSPTIDNEQNRLLSKLRPYIPDTNKMPVWKPSEINEVVDNPSALTMSLLEKLYRRGGPLDKSREQLKISTNNSYNNVEVVFGKLYDETNKPGSIVETVKYILHMHLSSRYVKKNAQRLIEEIEVVMAEISNEPVYNYDNLVLTDLLNKFHSEFNIFCTKIYPLTFRATLMASLIASSKNQIQPTTTVSSSYFTGLANVNYNKETNYFIKKWGHRSSKDYDLAAPSFREDKESLIDYSKNFAGYTIQSADIENENLTDYQQCIQMKEFSKDRSILYFRRLRPIILAIGRHLFPEDPDRIFLLPIDKIDQIATMPESQRTYLVNSAIEEIEILNSLTFYGDISQKEVELLKDVEAYKSNKKNASVMKGKMLGSHSNFSGSVIVNKNLDFTEAILKNKVILTSQLSPELVGVYDWISGIITSRGGHLSHAAIVAREKNIPVLLFESAESILSEEHDVDVSNNGELIIKNAV